MKPAHMALIATLAVVAGLLLLAALPLLR